MSFSPIPPLSNTPSIFQEKSSKKLTAKIIDLLNRLTTKDIFRPDRLENHVAELHQEIMSRYSEEDGDLLIKDWCSIFQQLEGKGFSELILDILIRSYFDYRREEPEYQFYKQAFYLAFLEAFIDNGFMKKLGHPHDLFLLLYQRKWVPAVNLILSNKGIEHYYDLLIIALFEFTINSPHQQFPEEDIIEFILKKYARDMPLIYQKFLRRLVKFPDSFSNLAGMGEGYLLITQPLLISYFSIRNKNFALSFNLHPLLYSHYARYKWNFRSEDQENLSRDVNPTVEREDSPVASQVQEEAITPKIEAIKNLVDASPKSSKTSLVPPLAEKTLAPVQPKTLVILPAPQESAQTQAKKLELTELKPSTDFHKFVEKFLPTLSPLKIDSLFSSLASYCNPTLHKSSSKKVMYTQLLSMWDWLFCHIDQKFSLATYQEAIWKASHHLHSHPILFANFLNAAALSKVAKQMFSTSEVSEELLAHIFQGDIDSLLEFWKGLPDEKKTVKGFECCILALMNIQPEKMGDLNKLKREEMLKEFDPDLRLVSRKQLKWLTTFTATPLDFGRFLKSEKLDKLYRIFPLIAAYKRLFQCAQNSNKEKACLNPVLAYCLLRHLDNLAKNKNDLTINYHDSLVALKNLFSIPKYDPKPVLDGEKLPKRQKLDPST